MYDDNLQVYQHEQASPRVRKCCRCNLPLHQTMKSTSSISSVEGVTISTPSTNRVLAHDSQSTNLSQTDTTDSSNMSNLLPPSEHNWRTLVVNCRSIKANASSLEPVLRYIKQDCVIASETQPRSK